MSGNTPERTEPNNTVTVSNGVNVRAAEAYIWTVVSSKITCFALRAKQLIYLSYELEMMTVIVTHCNLNVVQCRTCHSTLSGGVSSQFYPVI